MTSANKIIFFITLFFYQLGYAQKMVSFFDTTEYRDEKTQYILYKKKKFTGKYFVKFDTLNIIASVKNGIITNIEESGPAHKALYTVKNKDQYKKLYNAGGNLTEEGLLNDDEKDGEWKEYYSTGSAKSIMFYDKGKNSKTWSFFDANGEITRKIVFNNEVPFPESKNMNQEILAFADLDVRKQNCRSLDGLDKPVGNPYLNCDSVYFYKGLKYTGYAVSGDQRIVFTENGKPVFSKSTENNKVLNYFQVNDRLEKEGRYLELFPDGTIKMRGRYSADRKNGLWTEYYSSGNVKSEKKLFYHSQKNKYHELFCILV